MRLREALRDAEFTHDRVAEVLGPEAHAALGRNETVPALRCAGGGSPVETLVRLFLLQAPVPVGHAERALPGLVDTLAAEGIVGTGSHAPRGGVVATGGGLLFIGTSSDRKFRAYDADTGQVLWSYDLPAATEGVPAVYSVAGKQYVAIAVGGNGLFSQGMNQPAPGPGQYMVFALGASDQ